MSTFIMDPDLVSQEKIPFHQLPDGTRIPGIGLGTFGSDHISPDQIAQAVYGAAKVGYRHFDCAAVYQNEKAIGETFAKLFSEGLDRKEIWVTSKLWNNMHSPDDVRSAFLQSLTDLQLDHLDLYLIHWPFPNFHPPGCDVNARNPDAKPYIHENYMRTWNELEKLKDEGLVRYVGTSNMTIPKLELLLRGARIKPAVNEMELHPHFQQQELFDFCIRNRILPIGYSPIGSPNRPARDRTPDDTVDMEDPEIVRIAQHHGCHPASICLKWASQRGQIPIPFSIKRTNYLSNLKAISADPLTQEEMDRISRIDKNNRLIKGQVFLWKSGQQWEDLWDLDGTIKK